MGTGGRGEWKGGRCHVFAPIESLSGKDEGGEPQRESPRALLPFVSLPLQASQLAWLVGGQDVEGEPMSRSGEQAAGPGATGLPGALLF